MGVAGYQSDIDTYKAEFAEVQARLTELTDKTELYRRIIETCTRDRDYVITKIRKEVDRRLTEQERDRIEAMKADRFRIYRPTADYDDTFEEGGPAPNVDDCEFLVDSNMYDVKEKGSESEELTDRLEATYRYYNLHVGDLIAMDYDENTCSIFYIIQGNDATPDSLLNDAAERIITLTVKYCGGSGRIIKPEVI